ncbi:rRNA maturation RNase YbeY [Alloacidobacterium sp.]|uniref:rRNA maturation RNase YbeY n=1 Tax=Alloacidobacterium sp. TaxID=2951999 RepID=UPI002D57FE68|nr:rRNA maturation RNase YbeY [Alloacidobacterium sp.]HYK35670.1 rRNA maturation RNase YbeY [Alloacidobacterium sp.]
MILIEPTAASNQSELKAGKAALKMQELRAFLTKAKSAVGLRGEVSVLLATDATVRALNRNFRKKDKPTDVLSFPVDEFPGDAPKQAGDLAISIETAQKQADEHGHLLQIEVKILMLHGLLHLAGYDHETDKGQMAQKESALRKQLDLPVGLIQRSAPPARKNAAGKARSGRR